MEIIDFLFSNIAFLVAAIWFIASIFSRKQKEQQEQERNKNPRPVSRPIEIDIPWEKVEPEREEAAESLKHAEQKQVRMSATDIGRQRSEELLARAERIQSRERLYPRERNNHHRDRMAKDIPPAAQSFTTESKQVIDLSELDHQRVVQGMVWSQVFGLPRSKEPHRTWPRYVNSQQQK